MRLYTPTIAAQRLAILQTVIGLRRHDPAFYRESRRECLSYLRYLRANFAIA